MAQKGLGQDQEDDAIVRAIISLAKSLNLAITGEWIETAQQADLLGALRVAITDKGLFYGKPLDGAAMTALLDTASFGKVPVSVH